MAKRRNSNRRRRRGNLGFLYKLLSVFVICGAVILALTLFFRVNAVVVSGQERYTEEQVRAAAAVEIGDNLFLLDKYRVAQDVSTALPYVEEIRIRRGLPDTLLLEVRECGLPMAVWQGGSAWLVSPKGKIVEQLSPEESLAYARIEGCELLSPSVGTQIAMAAEESVRKESLLALLAALEAAGELEQVDSIHLADPGTLVLEYMGRFTVKLSYGADYAYKLRTLEAILDSGKIQENMMGTFDMRRDDGKTNFIQDR